MSLKFIELTSHDYKLITAALYLQINELRELLSASREHDPNITETEFYKLIEISLNNTIELLGRFGETEENIEGIGKKALLEMYSKRN